MPAKKNFKKEYISFVLEVALARGKLSNRMIASRLGVDEKTIRKWRKDHLEFNEVFNDAIGVLREKINNTAIGNLEIRRRNIVKNTHEGESTITEDVLPTHNDIAVFAKLGLSSSVVTEQNGRQDLLRHTMKRKIAGELTALEAAQLLESEGIAVPKTLMLEVQKSVGIVDSGISQPTIIQFVPPGEGDAEHNSQN